MSSEFQFEIQNFAYFCKHLKKILQRTKKTFSQINASSSFIEASKDFTSSVCEPRQPSDDGSPESLVRSMSVEYSLSKSLSAYLSPEDDVVLAQMTSLLPSLTIFSKDASATATFINTLFNMSLFSTDITYHPPIWFKYSAKNQIYTCFQSFDIVNTIGSKFSEGKKTTWENYIPNEFLGEVEKNRCVVISMPNSLLQLGLNIFVSSTTDLEDWPRVVSDSLQENVPIFLYLVGCCSLTNKEISFIRCFKSKHATSQLFFINTNSQTKNNSDLKCDNLINNSIIKTNDCSNNQIIVNEKELSNFPSHPQIPVNLNEDHLNISNYPMDSEIIQLNNNSKFYIDRSDLESKLNYQISTNDVHIDNYPLILSEKNNDKKLPINSKDIIENLMLAEQLSLLGFLEDFNQSTNNASFNKYLTKSETNLPNVESSKSCHKFDDFFFEIPTCLVHINDDKFWNLFNHFVRHILVGHLLRTCGRMIRVHADVLNTMVEMAFHMARDAVHVPPRIKFARNKEEELFKSLVNMVASKEDEMKQLIHQTIESQREELINKAAMCEFIDLNISNSGEISSQQDLKKCIHQIQEFIILNLNASIAGQLASSYNVLKNSYSGVLSRCLISLEQSDMESYGTTTTSTALKDILNAAYQVNINVDNNSSFVRNLIEKMKQLVSSIMGSNVSIADEAWKRKTATQILDMLTDAKLSTLSKTVCAQMCDRLSQSHKNFESSLKQLEQRHSGRLEKRNEHRFVVKKQFAPTVARLYLESRSLQDTILYGKPKLGPIIGNGEYGVVFRCEKWANFRNCAVKWIVPPDEKHWNDLAMELYYTKNVPEHDRIVTLRGTVVNYEHNGGRAPAVMFIMDKLKCDLHSAIQGKLAWTVRLQIAIDVVEGIRFLHSQGLVHRDIKLKNVLLDDMNRAKLGDLGFCKFEVMMTHSIVGTPIHMSPELVEGKYDNSVDIYAFGILFWYICSNSVRLPTNFERYSSKNDLWNAVIKGLRPEKPKLIDKDCWELMLDCWSRDPEKRPVAGEIESILRVILANQIGPSSTTTTMTKTTRDDAVLVNGAVVDDEAILEDEEEEARIDAPDSHSCDET